MNVLQGQMSHLDQFKGRAVSCASVSRPQNGGTQLLVCFGSRVLLFESQRSDERDMVAIEVTFARAIDSTGAALKRRMRPHTPQERAVVGRRFTGLDENVVCFGDVGFLFDSNPADSHWVVREGT